MLNTVKALINETKGYNFQFTIFQFTISTIFYTENKNMFINYNQLFRTREKNNKNHDFLNCVIHMRF